jgi:CheY-like chemotaxis protein
VNTAVPPQLADAHRHPVLVIDDDVGILASLKELLEFEGFEVATAEHGREGLELLAHERPSMILLDLMMPVMDGRQFLQALQQRQLEDPALGEIPVTVVSALDQARDLAVRYRCEVMRKPIEPEALLETVRRHYKA